MGVEPVTLADGPESPGFEPGDVRLRLLAVRNPGCMKQEGAAMAAPSWLPR